MRAPESDPEALALVFERHRHVIAFGFAATSDLLALYGPYTPLNESEIKLADMDRLVPDHEWFEERSKNLGISWSEEFDSYELPPRSFMNIALSYACSSRGTVHIEPDVRLDRKNRPTSLLKATFVFLGDDHDLGWHEETIILAQHLELHVQRRREKAGMPLPPWLIRPRKKNKPQHGLTKIL